MNKWTALTIAIVFFACFIGWIAYLAAVAVDDPEESGREPFPGDYMDETK